MPTSTPITIVGPKELVDFPKQGLLGVPAKVDTGADSSAIWASCIEETDGELRFVLFDRISPFYTGDILKTRKFAVTSIKNSFGQTEFRYKVTLRMRLAERDINVRFTLANRENNSHPILIGRRTLHGKFLVDVAAENKDLRTKRMLLMSTRISPSVSRFLDRVQHATDNLEIVHAIYDDVQFSFTKKGTRVTLLSTGEDIASFDIVHFKVSRQRDVTAGMARYLKKRGVKIVDESSLHFAGSSKLYQYVILADNAVSVPDSLYITPSRLAVSYDSFIETVGTPFVLKGIHASKGEHNYLIKDQQQFDKVCELINTDDVFVIGQRFIPNVGDYRVLVFGRRIALTIFRTAGSKDTHLNNTSQGGTATLVDVSDLPSAVQMTCIIAAKVLDLGVAGIDMVQSSKTGEWFCFEVNDGPQIATGAFTDEKELAFAKYIETELGK